MKNRTKSFLLAFSSFFSLAVLVGLFLLLKSLKCIIENSKFDFWQDGLPLVFLFLISISVLVEIGKPNFIDNIIEHVPFEFFRTILKTVMKVQSKFGDQNLLIILLLLVSSYALIFGFSNYHFVKKYLAPVDISYRIEPKPDASISFDTINQIEDKAHSCFKCFIDVLISPTYHDTLFDSHKTLDKYEVDLIRNHIVHIRDKYPKLSTKLRKYVSKKSDGIFLIEGHYSIDEGNSIILKIDMKKYFGIDELRDLILTFYDGELNIVELD